MLLRFLLDTLPFLIGFFAIYPIMLFYVCVRAYPCLRPYLPMPAPMLTYARA